MRLCGWSAPGATSVCTATMVTPAQSFAQVAGPNEQMTGTHKWNTGIVARGRIYFAASNKVYGLPFREGPPPNRKGNTTNARIETADGI
jgi:hypothetical protein